MIALWRRDLSREAALSCLTGKGADQKVSPFVRLCLAYYFSLAVKASI